MHASVLFTAVAVVCVAFVSAADTKTVDSAIPRKYDMSKHPIWSRWQAIKAAERANTSLPTPPIRSNLKKPLYDDHVYGADVSDLTSSSAFSCMIAANLTFAIVRCWRSLGNPDPNCPVTINSAWQGGLAHVDAYMFPCVPCGDPAGQMQQTVQFLQSNDLSYGMIWLDIERYAWSSDESANQEFFESMLKQGLAMGQSIGIYTSLDSWTTIMGDSYSGGSDQPLWYAHYDGVPDFSDFEPYGGWNVPSIKQFSDQGAKCGASYDINWYPPS